MVEAATFEHPIILSADGRVMDGMHRVLKALLAGRVASESVQFERDPEALPTSTGLLQPGLICFPTVSGGIPVAVV